MEAQLFIRYQTGVGVDASDLRTWIGELRRAPLEDVSRYLIALKQALDVATIDGKDVHINRDAGWRIDN